MSNNLWQVVSFDDLARMLRSCEKKFVVLAIFNNEAADHIKIMIRKMMKEKSKIYPKVTFLIYTAQKNDFGKLDPLFDKDQTKYPKVFHIYNVGEILSGTASIDNREILEADFKEYHTHYLRGGVPQQEEEDNIDEVSEISPKKPAPKTSKLQNRQTKESDNFSESIAQPENNVLPVYDPQIEKLKHEEKIKLLVKKQKECLMNFIEECGKRKKAEERESKKKGLDK